jgi:GNAT superfamily N-acetyltransferase
MSIHVRSATGDDGPTLLALVRKLADYEKLEPPAPDAEQRLLEDAFGQDPRIDVLIVEQDGSAVGYAIFFETYSSFLARPTLYLEDLFVVTEARGAGAGGAVMRWLAQEAVRRGCGRFEWQVLDWNRPAIGFYEHLGAQHVAAWQTYRLAGKELERLAGAPS